MAKPPHTRAAMRAFYPVCQVAELAAGYGYTTSELLEHGFGVLQVRRVKPLREPAVDGRQQRVRLAALPLALPQPSQAQGRPQLPRLRLLAAGNGEGLLEAGFRLGGLRDGLAQEEGA